MADSKMDRGADISDCGLYRYRLWRWWDFDEPMVGFVMLNPSTADATEDDPTIRRCMGFAKRWGHGGIMVVNLFAYRTSSPAALAKFDGDRVGPDNEAFLFTEARGCVKTIAAWGNSGALDDRGAFVHQELSQQKVNLYHLGCTNSGHPKHPLARGVHRIPDDTVPTLWAV